LFKTKVLVENQNFEGKSKFCLKQKF